MKSRGCGVAAGTVSERRQKRGRGIQNEKQRKRESVVERQTERGERKIERGGETERETKGKDR